MSKSAQQRDTNGFSLIKGCPLSCEGVFQYSAGQVGLPGDPNRIVNVYRPAEAVSDAAAIESFRDLPLVNDHEYLSGKYGDEADSAPEDKGVDGVLTGNVFWEAPWLRGDLKIFSRSMQTALEKGKKDLSLGFSCDFLESPGIWQGTSYEVVQTNLRGNHIALVDVGRVPGARVLDGLCFDHLDFTHIPSKEDIHMPKPNKAKQSRAMDEGNPAAELQALLPQLNEAFEKFMAQEAKEPEHQEDPDATVVLDDDDEEERRRIEAEKANAEVNSTEAEHHDAEAKAEAEKAEAERAATEAAGGDADLESLLAKVEGLIKGIREATGKGTTDEAKATDAIEGLQKDKKGAQIVVDADELEKITKKAEDAALARVYADAGVKDRIYDRVSKVVGSFDHRAMDSAGVYRYGARKLGLKCADAALPVLTATVDAYLDGMTAQNESVAKKVQDAAEGCPEIESYLKGGE